jgi:hypothetical protein
MKVLDMDKEQQMFLEVSDTDKANRVDMTVYRLERFSDTKNAWLFVRRRAKLQYSFDSTPNFIETNKVDEANAVDMSAYRFEMFSEVRGCWMFVKRRAVQG